MKLPSQRQQNRDFKLWERELRTGENTRDEETYVAPTRAERFGRALMFWFVSYDGRSGPVAESYSASDAETSDPSALEYQDPEDDGLNPA